MQRRNQWLSYARRFVMLSIASLLLAACQQKPETPSKSEPAKLAQTGETLYRVRLTAKAVAEYNIKTEPIREARMVRSGREALRKVVPITAVVSDGHGDTWAFTNPDSLVFVRSRLTVEYIDGDLAVLSDGPPTGTAVVTVGAAKLLGNEFKESEESAVERSEIGASGKGKKMFGTATMKEDGTIKLVYKTTGVTGLTADVVVEYKPKDEDYQKILDRIGGLQVGETKNVPPWPDK
jgi:hypothetical protein